MNYLEKATKTLEYDKILLMLSQLAQTQGAKERALTLLPSSDFETVVKRQTLTANAKAMAETKGAPSFGSVPPVLDILEKAQKNSVLSSREIMDVGALFRSARSLIEYRASDAIQPCDLTNHFDALVSNKSLETRIQNTFISEDLIADDATPTLADIRRKIRYQTNKIRELLQSFLVGENAKHLRDNVVTIRNGRYVLPVKIEDKNEIKGLIHDTSGSGSTLFIEPIQVVEANNDLRTLLIAENREIDKILSDFSAEINDFSVQLENDYFHITEIAFYFACAELSYRMNAQAPVFNQKSIFELERARHPLLNKETVVPINISLGEHYQMLVITGPNTGGKTVSLKTLGLFALMAQSGLQLPCDTANICIFDGVYTDIGDEQSIEQSLSTFSSHMVSIVKILNEITKKSLVLLDELGAGTDPIEGAALAQSILEEILAKGTLCASTTHYAELKAFALNTKNVMNASCEFNVNTLKPTYRLIIGTPGKSNAFLISNKLGISDEIISRAKSLIDDDTRNFESVIERLEQSRIALETEKDEIYRQKREFESFRDKAQKEWNDKLANAQKESEELMKKAQTIFSGAKSSAEFIFDQIDKMQKNKDKPEYFAQYGKDKKNLRAKMQSDDDIFNPIDEIKEDYVLPRPLLKGDNVLLKTLRCEGTLLENPDKSGNVMVQTGLAKTKTNISNLILVDEKMKSKVQKTTISERKKPNLSGTFSISCDVRGKNIEDAWVDVDKYLDEALLYNVKSVTIVHGKGTGALRKGLWEFFKKDKRIKKYRNGEYGEGDFGVTVIELKMGEQK